MTQQLFVLGALCAIVLALSPFSYSGLGFSLVAVPLLVASFVPVFLLERMKNPGLVVVISKVAAKSLAGGFFGLFVAYELFYGVPSSSYFSIGDLTPVLCGAFVGLLAGLVWGLIL